MVSNLRNFNKIPSMPERVLSALAYLTCGIVGIILIIASALLKIGLKPFVKFNAYQAILIGFIFGFLQLTYNLISGIFQFIGLIPLVGSFLNSFFQFIIYYLMGFPLLFGMSLLGLAMTLLILYLTVFTFLGKMPEIPYISNSIKRML